MKGKVICLLVLILVGTIACQKCQEKVKAAACAEKVDIAAEEEAIQAAVQKEMDAWKNMDYEGIAAVWVHEPYVYKPTPDGAIVGWDTVGTWFETTIREIQEKGPEYFTMRELSASNFDIHLKCNVAFVLYDEHSDYTWEGKDYSGVSRNMKYLEKKEGEWKLIAILPGR